MASLEPLSADHCILLAVQFAAESNLDALRSLLATRNEAIPPETAFRILLTYLPETLDPVLYTSLIAQIAGLGPNEGHALPSDLDISAVRDLSDTKAHRLAQRLDLLPLDHASSPAALADDLTTRFLIHRAHRVADAGVLSFLPQLLDPFLDDRPSLKTWFISNALPLLRVSYEFYTDEDGLHSLERLETAPAAQAVEILLGRSLTAKADEQSESVLARDLRGLVGPWMYGASDRKRRKLIGRREGRLSEHPAEGKQNAEGAEHESEQEDQAVDTEKQWDAAFSWLTSTAATQLPAIAEAMDQWNGPLDVDLGGYEDVKKVYADLKKRLEARYAQTAFAAVYAADKGNRETIQHAHGILVRLADLMDFDPPPDLATSVDMLPKIEIKKGVLSELSSQFLQPDALLMAKHPLTHPATDTFALLQLFVFSSYMFLELDHSLSIVTAAKVRFQYDADEQMGVIARIINAVSGRKRDDEGWAGVRSRLIWLWGWALPRMEDGDKLGHGIFGKIERGVLEKEILRAFLNVGCFGLAAKTYIDERDPAAELSEKDVEQVIISTALHHYDNASNGNRTRGGMKKASDMVSAFKRHFLTSEAFSRCEALLSATHSLSFYSLKLQHGVPFLPVNIRVSSDPVSLVEKVLAQNARSYTKLDDLISIATNLVASGVGQEMEDGQPVKKLSASALAKLKVSTERRVIGMGIEAALAEDDFETAYSYAVNRLTAQSSNDAPIDDISWRAALAAGRHKGSSTTSQSTSLSTPPKLRRLEQRMELLSQTLLLAPRDALPEVLGVWRKCEEEMLALQAAEAADEEAFNQRAAQDLPGSFINTSALIQPRREVGRGAVEESPMGLFDVARGAAAAFGRTAFPLHGAAPKVTARAPPKGLGEVRSASAMSGGGSDAGSISSAGADGDRLRKRDMISNAVTGGLASGIGWVIGAKPVDR